ncbi:MAG: hypothetical protein JO264_13255 [Acidisphaera sp.]|nr:hypothetical protein [Acidisphaera sp.]
MDRSIVYPGSIPLDTDLLSVNRNTMIALGALAQATLGTGMVADGLVCAPTAPASLTVTVGPGSITALTVVDPLSYGSLAADPADALVKMGVNLTPTPFTLTAPTTSGQSVNFLIQASFEESDSTPVVLPYYNAANPAQPYSGPANAGTAQNTQRIQRVQLELKPGAAAAAGSQTTPPVDSGWVGLTVITVNYGQTSIDASSIQALPGAPTLHFKLPQLAPGVSRMAVIAASGPWTVPAGVSLIRMRAWGGGGCGGNGGGGAGGGGAGGGYSEGYYPVTPGEALYATIGVGGTSGSNGGNGGATGLSALGSGSGGGGGLDGSAGAAGSGSGQPGAGFGTGALIAGSPGQGGMILGGPMLSGAGGTAFGGAGAVAVGGGTGATLNGNAGATPGSGGSGGIGNGIGGNGAPGLMIIEW